jgi:uncharacterized protein (TIGR03067 family)
MSIFLTIALAAGLLLAPDDTDKADKDKLESGTWLAVSIEVEGKTVAQAAEVRATFKGDEYTQKVGDNVVEQGKFKLDTTKSPKTIDFEILKGPDEGKHQVGLYELDGDTLKICIVPAGETERPKELKSREGTTVTVIVMKREKP